MNRINKLMACVLSTGAVLVSGVAFVAGNASAGPTILHGKSVSLSSKTLVVGSEVAPPTLDLTSNASAAIEEVVDYNVLQHLVQLSPNGTVVPELASSYSVSRNKTVYTFTLRKGVKFSNGDPLTPADVVYSMERVTAPGSKYPNAAVFDVKAVNAVGNNQVRVYLSQPSWSWLFDLAAYTNGVILDPNTVSTLSTDPIGTGPYMVTGSVPNSSVSLAANPHYQGTKPGYAAVEFQYFANANAENAALETGQIQVIDSLSAPSEVGVFNSKRYVIRTGLTAGKVQLTINNGVAPFNNVLVRRAIAYATDKKAIIDVAAAGRGVPLATDSVPGDPYYLNLTSNYPYDPTKAKQLLTEAGYPNGFSTTLTLPPYYYATLVGPVIQAQLAAVGIKVNIVEVQFPLWLSQVFEAANFDLTIIDHSKARDVSNYAGPYYWNYADTATVHAMLLKANEAPTEKEWIADTQKVLRLISRQAVNDWLYVLPSVSVHLSGVVGLPAFGQADSFDLSYARPKGTKSLSMALVKLGYGRR